MCYQNKDIYRCIRSGRDRLVIYAEIQNIGTIEKVHYRGALGCTVPPVWLVCTCLVFYGESLIQPPVANLAVQPFSSM